MKRTSLTRRSFVVISSAAGAGLVLGVHLPAFAAEDEKAVFAPNAFVQIDDAGVVRIWSTKSEMGQGVRTALPMIVVEELDADWDRVVIEQADLDPKYGRQSTGGSTSVRTMWEPLRKAGAAAREMLVAAAAQQWGVAASELTTAKGVVTHAASGRKATYGELASAAAKMPVPENPTLKDPKQFRLIGKSLRRVDDPAMVTGRAIFGTDVRVPGMLFASIERSPAFGGKVASFDGTKAKAVAGVREVVKVAGSPPPNYVEEGVAVVADSTWASIKGRRALEVKWDNSGTELQSTPMLEAKFMELAKTPGKEVRKSGDPVAAFSGEVKIIEADYETPFLAHAPMEPMNCVASVEGDRCEIWAPTQSADWIRRAVAERLAIKPENVTVHVTLMGGGFGRRSFPDFAIEAAAVSKAVGKPVSVVFTREDDMQHGWYRPMALHRMRAAISADGKLAGWTDRMISTPISGFLSGGKAPDPEGEIGGASELPYRVPNFGMEYHSVDSPIPRAWWRSVEHSMNAFAVESFVDEIAAATGKDPVALRVELYGDDQVIETDGMKLDTARLKRVLLLAAEKGGWGKPLPARRGRGIAAHFSFYSYAAHVVEVTVADDGKVRVDRVVCAIDCGTPVNPDMIAVQMEGGAVYGLSAALKEKITIRNGAVEQRNFNDFPMITFAEMPRIETHIVPSDLAPTGTGEPGLPPIAPALANAIFAATGIRIRSLPVETAPLKKS